MLVNIILVFTIDLSLLCFLTVLNQSVFSLSVVFPVICVGDINLCTVLFACFVVSLLLVLHTCIWQTMCWYRYGLNIFVWLEYFCLSSFARTIWRTFVERKFV